jgi:hypothetical protein
MNPEIIQFCGKTKGGVTTLNQICHTYSVSRKTRHWPMTVFYGMLEECGIIALILMTNGNPLWKSNNIRCCFLKDLGLEPARPHMNKRLKISYLP